MNNGLHWRKVGIIGRHLGEKRWKRGRGTEELSLRQGRLMNDLVSHWI